MEPAVSNSCNYARNHRTPQLFHDGFAFGSSEMPYSTAIGKFTFRNVRQPIRERAKTADQIPHRLRWSWNIDGSDRFRQHRLLRIDGQWSLDSDESLLANFTPEIVWDSGLERGMIFCNPFGFAGPRDDRGRSGVGEREL